MQCGLETDRPFVRAGRARTGGRRQTRGACQHRWGSDDRD